MIIKPKKIFVQPNTFIVDGEVTLKEYALTKAGVIESFIERDIWKQYCEASNLLKTFYIRCTLGEVSDTPIVLICPHVYVYDETPTESVAMGMSVKLIKALHEPSRRVL